MNDKEALITIRGQRLLIDVGYEASLGLYGEDFWKEVGSGLYEPPTFNFIDDVKREGFEDFIDVGAATGCMSLYASSIGLKVLAFEPQFKVFQAFERNLSLNLEAKKNIRAEFALVVGAKDAESLNHSFTPGASGPLSQDGLSSRAFTIQDILEWQPIDSRTAIKIDIEGAEFPLFGNPETVHLLQIKHPRIYLALHPGFKNPLPSNAGALRKIFWRFGAVVDILSLYRSVRNKATIQNAIRKNKVGIFGLLKGLLRDEKDYILIF